MKTITREYKLFDYSELSKEAKQKAIENLYDINVDYEWYLTGTIEEMAIDYGLKVNENKMYFDLDRGSYLYFDDIRIDNYKKFFKIAGVKKIDYEASIGIQYYGGSEAKNTIDSDNKLQECLDSFIDKALSHLRKDYQYLTGEEAIIETIKSNEYTFLEEGTMFNG